MATPLFTRLKPKIDAIELPPGYSRSRSGEYEDSKNAQSGLASSLPAGFLAMILTSILLFGKLRQPLIIWLTVPLAIVGVTAGLLIVNGAFDFMSILVPLLTDVFFVNMSITIMAGLGFATVLTLLIVPTLYAVLFGIRPASAASQVKQA